MDNIVSLLDGDATFVVFLFIIFVLCPIILLFDGLINFVAKKIKCYFRSKQYKKTTSVIKDYKRKLHIREYAVWSAIAELCQDNVYTSSEEHEWVG